MEQITEGLWRWTAPHPDWVPGSEPDSPEDWEREVGCALCRDDGHAIFFDPLLPPASGSHLEEVDRIVGDRSVLVLTTIHWHRRDRDAFAERYGVSASSAVVSLPDGVTAHEAAGETMFWLPESRALICGDRIVGDTRGGIRLCPESWMRSLKPLGTHARLREELRPLLELPIERVLVSHGEPILSDGLRALEAALED